MSTQMRAPESELTRFYGMFPYPSLARDLFNIIEGHRIDYRLRMAYPGIRRDMDVIRAITAGDRPELVALSEARAVVEALLQHTIGIKTELDGLSVATQQLIVHAQGLLDRVADEDASVSDSAALTAEIYVLIDDAVSARDGSGGAPQQAGPDNAPPLLPQDQPDSADIDAPQPDLGLDDYEDANLPPFMTPVMEELVKQRPEIAEEHPEATGERPEDAEAKDDLAPEDVQGTMETREAQVGGEQAGDEVAEAAEGEADQAPGAASSDLKPEEAAGGGEAPELTGGEISEPGEGAAEEDLGEKEFPYDEWDFRIEDYRPAWCTLRESRATRTQEGFVAATFHEYGGIVTQIRRNFQLMRPERMRKMRFQTEGDDLDTDGLVEYVVDRKARVTPSGRVYIKRDKKDRDVTTAFLVDMSSSTDRRIDANKTVMDVEKQSLLLMCEALEAIRDEYAIYGFSGDGRDNAEFYVVKELGDRYDDRIRARIGGIYARQKTRMGPAIRHTTKRLAAADSTVKLMILLTDGKPYDTDTYQDNEYAQEDTKVALREARREKIHLFCVTVDTEGADYLPHMYSDANFVVVDDVRTLPLRLPQLYRRLTT
ncbi:MAG: VWA domain-containing protein [Thermoleophilia bacterium]|nr:VWA domain-containing protein [Thermoleophilia bacterium]